MKRSTDTKGKDGKLGLHVLVALVVLFAGVLAWAVFVNSPAFAQTAPTIITIDAPGAGTTHGQGTWATAINASGAIAGYFIDSSNGCHGFLRNPDGTFVSFAVPLSQFGAPTCPAPTGMNQTGAVTGRAGDPSFGCTTWSPGDRTPTSCGGTHGFVRMPDGTILSLDAPTALSNSMEPSGNINPQTLPAGINSAGEVTGIYTTSEQATSNSSFLWTPGGGFVSFDPPNANQFTGALGATSVNATGTIGGDYRDGSTGIFHGFLRATDGSFTVVDVPGAAITQVVAINSTGELTGAYSDASYVQHGYVRAPDGTFSVFDVPSSCAGCIQVVALNDSGTVLGMFSTSSGVPAQAFLRAADGTFTTFTPPGEVAGVNSSRAVIGTYLDTNTVAHGFFLPGVPHVSSFTPNSGTSGTTVTITGTSFTGATRVAFNRVAGSFTVDSDTQITATVPGGATTGPISVTTPSGTGWSFSGTPFTVDSAGAPTISSFSPGSGWVTYTVTLTGTNFTGTTGVSFNGTPATTMWAISDTQYNAKVPSGATSGPITLTNSLRAAVSATNFTVTPHISSFTATSGTMGTTVTITGTNFTGATRVTFFRVAASFTVVSDTQITATVPGGATSGWISVKTADGTAWSSSNFNPTSAGAPSISSFSPGSGTVGATITLTGTNFTGTTAVSINGTAATTFWATSDTQLNVKIPSGATSGPITVTNTAGTTSSANSLTVY